MSEITPNATVYTNGRTISFIGEIFSISAFQLINEVRKLEKKSNKPIILEINSEGGNIVDGFFIYDSLKLIDCPIYTIGTGCIESMAVPIFLAGEKRYCTERCTFMYHQGTIEFDPGEIPLLTVSKVLNDAFRLDNLCNNIVIEKTKLSLEDINFRINSGDWYFNAQEAYELGFVDRILKA